MTWLELMKGIIFYAAVLAVFVAVSQKYVKKSSDMNTQQKFAIVSLVVYFLVMRILAEIYHWSSIINYIVCFIGLVFAVVLRRWCKRVT